MLVADYLLHFCRSCRENYQ